MESPLLWEVTVQRKKLCRSGNWRHTWRPWKKAHHLLHMPFALHYGLRFQNGLQEACLHSDHKVPHFHLLFGLCMQISQSLGDVVAVHDEICQEESQHEGDEAKLNFATGTPDFQSSPAFCLNDMDWPMCLYKWKLFSGSVRRWQIAIILLSLMTGIKFWRFNTAGRYWSISLLKKAGRWKGTPVAAKKLPVAITRTSPTTLWQENKFVSGF